MRFVVLFMLLFLTACSSETEQDLAQKDSKWFVEGQSELEKRLAQKPIKTRAKNIILMVADGNGVGTNYALRLFAGQSASAFGEEHVLPHERLAHLALVKTYNVNAQTPDSAGTATAMLTGVKTNAGVLGFNETVHRGDCKNLTQKIKPTSFASLMKAQGRSVGIVSTARLTHATPAAAYAYSADRNWEDDRLVPEGCAQSDIALQLFKRMTAGDIDLALGGGRRHFLPREFADNYEPDGRSKKGRRGDGRNLIEEAKAADISVAWDQKTFEALGTARGKKVLGLFEPSHMKYEQDRTGEPSISEMAEMAVKSLSGNDEGYFLLIEAGRVDHANHAGNLHRALTDGVAFAKAVERVMALTSAEDTLLIVTADHEHAIAFNGYCGRGSPITGLCYEINMDGMKHTGQAVLAKDGKPYTVAGYLNGPGTVFTRQDDGSYAGSRKIMSNEEAKAPDYLQQALVPLKKETHSGEDVAVYARGPWAHLFNGTIEQNFVFHVMRHASGFGD